MTREALAGLEPHELAVHEGLGLLLLVQLVLLLGEEPNALLHILLGLLQVVAHLLPYRLEERQLLGFIIVRSLC